MREYIDIFNRIVDKLSNAHARRNILFSFHHNDSFNINNDETTITITIYKHNLDSSVMTTIFQQQAVFRGPTPQITDRTALEIFWQDALAGLGFRGILHIDAIYTFRENEQEIQSSPESGTVDGGRV